jgi:hypothetical protein
MSRKVPLCFVVGFLALGLAAACSEKQGISSKNIHPVRGPYLGGDPVTISDTGLSATLIDSIRFGKNKARPPVVKENGDVVVEPPAGNPNETVDIEIILNDARVIKIPAAYTYIDPTAPAPAK